MSRFSIELAKPSDDGDLRRLVAESPVGRGVQFVVRREPSFFHVVRLRGPFSQVGVVRDSHTGKVIGCGTRAVRSAYINGTAANLGWLGGLLLEDSFRSGTLLGRGYRIFHQLHRDRKALLYVTTIPEEDREVRELLTSGRVGLPQYDDLGRYDTLAISPGRAKRGLAEGIRVVHGSAARMDEVEDCLNRNGQRRQFYPCYLSHEFLSGAPHLRDFHVNDFFLALREGRVVGVAGRWDQGRMRQIVVTGYRGKTRLLRPLVNATAGLRGYRPMPPPGSELKCCFVGFVAVDDDDPEVFRAILREIYNDAAAGGYDYLLAGFHDSDPLRHVAARYRHFTYRRRLYVVYWEDGAEYRRSLDDRVPYLELATM